MPKYTLLFAMPIAILVLTACESNTTTTEVSSTPVAAQEAIPETPAPAEPESVKPTPTPTPEPTPTPAVTDPITTAAIEVQDEISSAPVISSVSRLILSTREPEGLVIRGENLTSVTLVLRSEAGAEIPLDVYDQDEDSVTIPDQAYPENTAGIYDLIARTADGQQVIYKEKITITDEK